MRALLLLSVFAACTPDIVAGAYLCGPDGACPDGLACSGASNTCVLPSQTEPFACTPKFDFEPDDTSAEAHLLEDLQCVSAPFKIESCMLEGDAADWVMFVPPAVCTAVEVQVRLSFPIAFADLGLELWDLDGNVQLATDGECLQGADTGDVRRCLDHELVPGKKYGLKVSPTGEGTCDGSCSFNKYFLSVQLATPG